MSMRSHWANVLLVDDEDNVLKSLQRGLRKEPYALFVASSGPEALACMEENDIDLVISDARMPEMDGPTLLAIIKKRWPDCVRILLTGYTDMATTVKAINEGKIYRYISKPWDDDELKSIIKQGLGYQYAERERRRLQKLTEQQNLELQTLNQTLEQRVAARAQEVQQTADMLDLAYDELKRSYVTATEVFSSLINLRLKPEFQTNARAIRLVKRFAEHRLLDDESHRDLSMAAALYNLGKLSWPDAMISIPRELIRRDQKVLFLNYPVHSERLLMALDPLQGAAKVIRHHQEKWNGTGHPDHLGGEDIPLGSRMLRLVVDFIELQVGLVLDKRFLPEDALTLMAKYRGKFYDPELFDQFAPLALDDTADAYEENAAIKALDTRRLTSGMLLARDLYASSGVLLLNAGKVLSEPLIEKLIAFEESEPEGAHFTLYVDVTDATESE